MIDLLRRCDSDARKRFTYEKDDVDQWRSHAEDVKAKHYWRGDCDDLTSTVCHLAIEDGFHKEDLWFAMVSDDGSKMVNHLVGLAWTTSGLVVIGDTHSDGVYKVEKMKHRLLFIHRLDWPLRKWESITDLDQITSLN